MQLPNLFSAKKNAKADDARAFVSLTSYLYVPIENVKMKEYWNGTGQLAFTGGLRYGLARNKKRQPSQEQKTATPLVL